MKSRNKIIIDLAFARINELEDKVKNQTEYTDRTNKWHQSDMAELKENLDHSVRQVNELKNQLNAGAASATFDDLRQLMDPEFVQRNKISAIRHIRRITGSGIRESKEFVETYLGPISF